MLLKLGGLGNNYIHASNLIPEGQTGQGDLTKAKYFGLIKAMPETSEAKKSSGYWSLTEDGHLFVTGKKDIPSHLFVFDDKVIGKSEEKIFKLIGLITWIALSLLLTQIIIVASLINNLINN